MRIAVIGGGINGLCCAWQLAQAGHQVELFEAHKLLAATSSASSKLLHGGLRYLEQGDWRLVREALHEREWWLSHNQQFTRRVAILYPLYQQGRRPRWQLKLGLWLYDALAATKPWLRHRWLDSEKTLQCSPRLQREGLLGAYCYFDGQMDELGLGHWVAWQAQQAGVLIHEHTAVSKIDAAGRVWLSRHPLTFDRIINVAGPWSEQLLRQSGIEVAQQLDLVRGSHLLLPPISRYGHILEVPHQTRLVFALPYQGQTLLGTTEVRQQQLSAIECSGEERDYLLAVYNHYFSPNISEHEVLGQFAGVRPLLAGRSDASKASREYALNWSGKILTVSGGKWTTARALGQQVVRQVAKR